MTGTSKLSEDEGKELLKAARETIRNALTEKQGEEKGGGTAISPKFSEKRGTFVTLTIMGRLRRHGLLVEAVDNDGQLWLTVPTDLRPMLDKILS